MGVHTELIDIAWDAQTEWEEFISTFSIHSAFQDAITKSYPKPRARQSIEVRCVAIWDDDDHESGNDNY